MTRAVTLAVLTSFAGLVGLPFCAAAHHLVTEMYNLEQIVAKADRGFVGTVTGRAEDYIQAAGGSIPITAYTFAVDEVLKGSVGRTLTIKQVGHRSDPSSLFGEGLPEYQNGTVVMLFLHADSKYGLTSPVGLDQGAFLINTRGPMKVSVSNGRGNRGLLERSARIDALLQAESPTVPHPLKISRNALPYAELRNLVIKLLHP